MPSCPRRSLSDLTRDGHDEAWQARVRLRYLRAARNDRYSASLISGHEFGHSGVLRKKSGFGDVLGILRLR